MHADERNRAMSEALGEDVETAFANQKYGFIQGALKETYTPGKREEASATKLIDTFVTHKLWGFPIFFFLMWLMFWCTFSLGAYPQEWIDTLVGWIGSGVDALLPAGPLRDLLVDGIIGGVGAVIVFLPNIMILYLFISFMEDSGYLARAAFIMDRVMHRIGLHGKSFIPLIMGFGCNVPAIMACRTIESRSSRLITILITPFMSCSARIPIYLLLAGTFFAADASMVMIGLYVLGVVLAVVTARLMRRFMFPVDETPFVMELPPYRLPTLFSVLMHCWERTWMYVKKAGTVILAISIIIWAGLTYPKLDEADSARFDTRIEQLTAQLDALPDEDEGRAALEEQITRLEEEKGAAELAYSYAGRLGKAIEPLTLPAGFEWRTDIALLAGVAAKEAVVSTMGTAYSLGDVDPEDAQNLGQLLRSNPNWNKATALSLMLFVLLYSPCFVSLVVIQREAGGWRWLIFSMVFNTLLAFAVSVAAYQIGLVVWD